MIWWKKYTQYLWLRIDVYKRQYQWWYIASQVIGDAGKWEAAYIKGIAWFNRALIRYKQLEYQKMEKEYDLKAGPGEKSAVKAADYEMVKLLSLIHI